MLNFEPIIFDSLFFIYKRFDCKMFSKSDFRLTKLLDSELLSLYLASRSDSIHVVSNCYGVSWNFFLIFFVKKSRKLYSRGKHWLCRLWSLLLSIKLPILIICWLWDSKFTIVEIVFLLFVEVAILVSGWLCNTSCYESSLPYI